MLHNVEDPDPSPCLFFCPAASFSLSPNKSLHDHSVRRESSSSSSSSTSPYSPLLSVSVSPNCLSYSDEDEGPNAPSPKVLDLPSAPPVPPFPAPSLSGKGGRNSCSYFGTGEKLEPDSPLALHSARPVPPLPPIHKSPPKLIKGLPKRGLLRGRRRRGDERNKKTGANREEGATFACNPPLRPKERGTKKGVLGMEGGGGGGEGTPTSPTLSWKRGKKESLSARSEKWRGEGVGDYKLVIRPPATAPKLRSTRTRR